MADQLSLFDHESDSSVISPTRAGDASYVARVLLRLQAFLLIGAAYQMRRQLAHTTGARRSYWRHVEKRRAAARAERRRNREKWRAYQKAYVAANRDKLTACAARWRHRNAARVMSSHLLRTYGLTLDEYYARLHDQGGGCAICGAPESRSPGRKGGSGKSRLHVDHDHVTQKPRGLLCDTCNRGIGQLGDDLERVRAAVRYLERYQEPETQRLDPVILGISRRVLGRYVPISRELMINAERIRRSLAAA